MAELDDLQAMTQEDINIIRGLVKRSVNVDQILYDDVLNTVMEQKTSEILGVETNGAIKELLRKRELREAERRARIHIKLTRDERQAISGPSISDGSAPKMYQRALIPTERERWAREIGEEVDRRLGLRDVPTDESPEAPIPPGRIQDIVRVISYRGAFIGDSPNIKMDDKIIDSMDLRLREELTRALSKVKIRPERIARFTEMLQARFLRALAMPGKLVGNIMASSFGEAATQQTLNTFHSAGDAKARKQITGFGKFNSLLEATENPQSNTLTIFMHDNPNGLALTGEQMRLRISNIQATILSELVESHRVFDSSEPQPEWEIIADTINGINYAVTHPPQYKRFNLHRFNTGFSEIDNETGRVKGRILEIKLNTSELGDRTDFLRIQSCHFVIGDRTHLHLFQYQFVGAHERSRSSSPRCPRHLQIPSDQ
jgi:hypothetical protein